MNISMQQRFGCYYTNPTISSLLVSQISFPAPELVLELGAGRGSLITAAAKRWHNAYFLTTDIDQNIAPYNLHPKAYRHVCADALEVNLHQEIGVEAGQVDVAVCNPPYIRPKWRKEFSEILEDAGLSGVVPAIQEAPAVILFLAQNLRFLQENGELGIIVPDGFITSSRYIQVRSELLKKHKISSVIELPENIFSRTEAQTHIVTMKKGCENDTYIPVYRANPDGTLSQPIMVDTERAVSRLDYKHYDISQNLSKPRETKLLKHIVHEIRRGSISRKDADASNLPYFHTTNFSEVLIERNSVIFKSNIHENVREQYVAAEPGDILLARVGRSLNEQIAFVKSGSVIITDCVYRIRVEPKYRDILWNTLNSEYGRSWIKSRMRGVCAKILSKDDLSSIPLLVK